MIRKQIDLIDDMLVLLLSERQELVHEIGQWKKIHHQPIADPKREKDILKKRLALLQEANLDHQFIRDIYRIIFQESRTIQRRA
ncbi:MAG TPA: chorismate mutase [Bacteroidota bacterium]|nr:chorismate mutase [Bacteroidota bacterium]